MKLTLVVTEDVKTIRYGTQKVEPVVTVNLTDIDAPRGLAAGILRAAADQIDPQHEACDATEPWTVTR